MANNSSIIHLENLRHNYGATPVLNIADWQLAAGEHAALIGPSGSGKTTLLAILAGMLQPTAGRVQVSGEDLATLGPARRDRFRGQNIGIVFQDFHLIDALTVADNVRMARRLAGMDADEAHVRTLLTQLGVIELADAKPPRLSHGQAQRVAIARALANRPHLVLADEPTSALDDANAAAVLSLLQEQAASAGASLVVATHDSRIKSAFTNRLELTTSGAQAKTSHAEGAA